MFEEIRVLTHSSIRIEGELTLYFDPFKIKDETHDADIIFVTHNHYDHYSPEDIDKVKNASTVFVMPKSLEDKAKEDGIDAEFVETVEPGDKLDINDIHIEAVPAYNVDKNFHPKENSWVGYLVEMAGVSYYVAGDTDINDDVVKVRCDAAMLPCGGKYTMDYKEAAKLAGIIGPKLAVPTHYGSVAGDPGDGERFAGLLKDKVEVSVRMEY